MVDRRPCVIFDLDDTLYDCTGMVKNRLIWRVARVLSEELNLDKSTVYQDMIRVRRNHPLENYFHLYLNRLGLDVDRLVKICESEYTRDQESVIKSGELTLFEGCRELLSGLMKSGWRLFLVTKGHRKLQNLKIDVLGIRDYFEGIYIVDSGGKSSVFDQVISVRNINVSRLVIVGDRPNSEISIGLKLGARVIHYMWGCYRNVELDSGLDSRLLFRCSNIKQLSLKLSELYDQMTRRLKIVCLGGGTGQPLLLSGLLSEIKKRGLLDVELCSVVAVTDSGRSSGRLRELFKCQPPGDCRNCLMGMIDSQTDLHRLFQYRFDSDAGELEGHSLGNLMLTALMESQKKEGKGEMGKLKDAVDKMETILGIDDGRKVLPVCDSVVDLCAQLENEEMARGEVEVRKVGKSPIHRVWVYYSDPILKKQLGIPKVSDDVVSEILSADLVVLGPGSFYTSVLCNLMYARMVDSLRKCCGKVIWVSNLTTQPGQTDRMTLSDHYQKLIEVLGNNVLNGVIVNNVRPNESIISEYSSQGVDYIGNGIRSGTETGCGTGTRCGTGNGYEFLDDSVELISGDLLENRHKDEDRNLWNKQDCIRHDPSKLGKTIFDWMFRNFN